MELILDASCLVNVLNADAFQHLTTLTESSFSLGTIVLGEVSRGAVYRDAIGSLVADGLIKVLDGRNFSAAQFLALSEETDLGPGEVECMVFAASLDRLVIACDDGKARREIATRFGRNRLTGSIDLLKELCSRKLLDAREAFAFYRTMVKAGGYLPELHVEDFGI